MEGEPGLGGQRPDLYREVHKRLRCALFTAVVEAGRADPGDPREIADLIYGWRVVRHALQAHHEHEATFVDPLVDKFVSHVRSNIDQDHATIERTLDDLDLRVTALGEAADGARAGELYRFYLDLSRLCVVYLDHMAYEEEVVMPELSGVLTDEELAEAVGSSSD
jgi:hypothetical protein